jgi:hypothetical protein
LKTQKNVDEDLRQKHWRHKIDLTQKIEDWRHTIGDTKSISHRRRVN